MLAVHFGARNIGRGFIGLTLVESGFDVVFVETNSDLVNLINGYGEYPVRIIGRNGEEERWVRGVRALHAQHDREAIALLIGRADIVTTAVGKAALPMVAPLIAEGLRRRVMELPVLVVACENVLGNSEYLAALVRDAAGSDAAAVSSVAYFPNCVVDRIVPQVNDWNGPSPLVVSVEEYHQWVIDARTLRRQLPIRDVEYRDDLDVVLVQKLCTMNMAHAIVGYWGHRHGYRYVHEAMNDDNIRELLHDALAEASGALQEEFGIPVEVQAAYVARVMERLQNAALQDAISRVARDPQRKLGARDRLIYPARLTAEHGGTPAHLATGIAAALAYDAEHDVEARALQRMVGELGVRTALRTVSGVPEDHVLTELVHASAHFGRLRTA